MEIRQIRHFLAVAETGSFTKGSEQAAISQPALSASIAKLEEELGVRLLDRTPSRVVPTAAGAKLVERAYSLLLIYNTLKSEVCGAASAQPLRVGVLQTISCSAVGRFIARFQQANPALAIEVIDGSEDDLAKRACDGRLDVVFSTPPKDGSRKLGGVPLLVEHLMLALPVGHALCRSDALTLRDLRNVPLIERNDCVGYYAFAKALSDSGVDLRIAYRTDRDDRALKLVSMGIGISTIPGLFSHDGVVLRRLSDFEYTRAITLQWPVESTHGALKDFIAAATAHGWAEQTSPKDPHVRALYDRPGIPRRLKA